MKQRGLRVGSVKYLKLNEVRNRIARSEDLPFLKRYPFEPEAEFRMIYSSRKRNVSTLALRIPLSCIDRISLSPWIHDSLSTHVTKTLKSLKGCSDLSVVRSTLISNQEWKAFGESARKT